MIKTSEWTVDYFLANKNNCISMLENAEALQEIPSLNNVSLDSFKDGQLVRFQGMLQDMYNPEYYFKSYQVANAQTGEQKKMCGMYRDAAQCQPHENVLIDSLNNESAERQTWIVVSTPGMNDWTKDICMSSTNKNKNSVATNYNKRSLDEAEEPMDCSDTDKKKQKVSNEDIDAGSSQAQQELKTAQILSKDYILNFPIPDKNGKACMAKVYEDYPCKLNQIIEIIGFLSVDPSLSQTHDSESSMDLEIQVHYPPASIIPRLHVIKLAEETNKYIPELSNIFLKAESVRSDLRMVLSQLLFGDDIAADFLICHLISSVYLRRDCLCLGAFSINISNYPKQYINFIQDFYGILKQIIAKSHFIDLTLENLNEMNLVPKKDYDSNRLNSGMLQLSKNTHLIIDETKLTTGEVTACGKENYNAISHMIQFQKLEYNFKFYNIEYETDIPVLILSETKSFIPCPSQIVLQPDTETMNHYPQVVEAAKQYIKDEDRLNNLRNYVNGLKHSKFEFSENISEIIQEDFVKLRQTNKNFSADHLHALMLLSRLMALSYGMNSLTPEMWKKCLEMEKIRLDRLPKRR